MIALAFDLPAPWMMTVMVVPLAWSAAVTPDWFRLIRTIMMVLGGIVVVAIVLIVAVAIISGVMGMLGRLRKRR